ncbi:TonB-dependent receptor [Shewanella amazonensis]|uniref:Uncharacterized protein n=1 Tax=Shewanella amazonensis (strain ATCC BAA-1098 / SB2B) TaxID=326297 RepID=A1S323_SHEAM|nr:TonB-dependent receptor [Shewanella amazonensis]ABL98779.1 conserved hypothetical protein [Shewanella amazonensis SB2B]
MKVTEYLLLSLLYSGAACAGEWQFNGYLSQGLVAVSGSDFFTDGDDVSFSLSEASLMTSWRPTETIRLAGALVYRQRGNLSDEHFHLDYLFAEYLYPLENGFTGIRLGRVKNEIGFYSSTRDVPFTRPAILLPQSIYADYYRDAQSHVDGGELLGHHSLSGGILEWNVSGGVLHVTDDLSRNIIGSLDYGRFQSDYFYSLDIDYSNDRWRLGGNLYQTRMNFETDLASMHGDVELLAYVLSAQYRWSQWEFTTEFSRGWRTLSENMLLEESGAEQPYRGYYLDVRYLMGEQLEWFVRYDHSVENLDDPHGKRLAQQGLPEYFGYSKDWSLGLKWRFADSWQLGAEYHWVEGASWVPPIVNKIPATQDEDWSIFALQLSYRLQW